MFVGKKKKKKSQRRVVQKKSRKKEGRKVLIRVKWNITSHNSIQYKADKEFESREYKIVKNKVIWSLLRNYFRKTPFYVFLFIYLLLLASSFQAIPYVFLVFFLFLLFIFLLHITYVGSEMRTLSAHEKFVHPILVNTQVLLMGHFWA